MPELVIKAFSFGLLQIWRHLAMKSVVFYFYICVVLLGAWGCAPKSAKLQKSVTPPDETLYDTGNDYLNKGQFLKSRLAFQTLINTYSDSNFAADAYFAMAESFYTEGGTENLLNAEEQYGNFIIFFPTNPKVAEAMMKNIALSMKMMQAPDRDQQNTYRALRHINLFLEKFPSSDYTPLVKKRRTQVEETLALGDFMVAQIYAEKLNAAAVQGRLKTIMDNYLEFSRMDEVYAMFASNLDKAKNIDEAAVYMSKIVTGFPYSKYYESSKQWLAAHKKPVPSVDENLAALHKSRVKDDSFNPLKVFADIGKAFGITGQPDVWKEANKTIQEEKAKAAEASGEKGEGGGAAIKAVIKKTADGKSSESYSLSQEPNASQPNDPPVKKKTVNKNKRQSIK
jgi:outer membrane assembly lipoprotein YfiO